MMMHAFWWQVMTWDLPAKPGKDMLCMLRAHMIMHFCWWNADDVIYLPSLVRTFSTCQGQTRQRSCAFIKHTLGLDRGIQIWEQEVDVCQSGNVTVWSGGLGGLRGDPCIRVWAPLTLASPLMRKQNRTGGDPALHLSQARGHLNWCMGLPALLGGNLGYRIV